MKKRGQTAAEYLVVIALVIVIAIIVVVSLGGVPSIGGKNSERASEAYWSSADIAITSWAAYDNGTIKLFLKNNREFNVKITGISVDSSAVFSGSSQLRTGAEKTFTGTLAQNCSDIFESDITITYLVVNTGAAYSFTGEEPLRGDCVVTNTTSTTTNISGNYSWFTGTQTAFDTGSYANTTWSSGVILAGSNTTGTYTSEIFNANATAAWDIISWIEDIPYGEELPDNKAVEAALGGVNMTGNVLLLHMNEGSGTIIDSSGGGNDGTSFGGITYGATGKFNTALRFDGQNDYVSVGTGLNSALNNNFTFAAWIYPEAQNKLIFGNKGTTGSRSIAVDIWDINKITAAEEGIAIIGGASYPGLNQWIHVAWTFDNSSSTHRLYVNGLLGGNFTYSFSGDYSGSSFISDDAENLFNGTIDEVAVWNRTLSATEILNIYKRGASRLNVSIRSCNDPACSGEPFTSTMENSTGEVLSVSNNQYFQYRYNFLTENSTYTPKLYNVTVNYTIS